MTELIQKAINHIDQQAEKSTNPIYKAIAQYIIESCLTTDENAQKALSEDKTLEKCANTVKSNARSEAVSGCAVVADSIVWRWVREYYGFSEMQSNAQPVVSEPIDILDFM